MSDTASECCFDIDNFPSIQSIVKNCLNMKLDTNVEGFHQGNRQTFVFLQGARCKKNRPLIL